MEEFKNLLKLKKENEELKNEIKSLKSIKKEQPIAKEYGNDIKSLSKIKELNWTIKKLKEKNVSLKIELEADGINKENKYKEILKAISSGSYGVTFKEFLMSISNKYKIQIPLEDIFGDIYKKMEESFEKKIITHNEQKNIEQKRNKAVWRKALKDAISLEKKYQSLLEEEIGEHENKIITLENRNKAEIKVLNTKHLKELNSFKLKFYSEINEANEFRINHKQVLKESNLAKTKHSILLSESKKFQGSIDNLKKENHFLSQKLENCQKELSKYLKKKKKGINVNNLNIETESMKFSSNNDGSHGWDKSIRESGKFGSLPSFDNYDDDYLDNNPEGFE